MSSEYRLLSISDVVHEIYDGPHATPEKTKKGPVFLGISNLENGRLNLSDTDHLSDESFREWTRRVTPRAGDLVFSYETRLGEAALIPENLQCCLGRRMGLLRIDREVANPRYLLYAWLSPEFQREIQARASQGSTVNRILLTELGDYPVRVPSLPTQRRIADILGALDDKIELNRQMNQTLEAMAQALYRHWFVDFGPFQDSPFVDSALGPIPKGWSVGSLDDIIQNIRGTIDPDDFPDSTPYIGLGEMPKGSIQIDDWNVAAEAGSRKRSFQKGQLLFGKLRPYFKKVGFAPVDGICSTDMLVLEPTEPHFRSMALCQLIQDDFIEYTNQAATGTRMPRISWKRMRDYDVAIPPVHIAEAYERRVGNWFDMVIENIHQNQTLAETRDYLLPKLISGEIEVNPEPAESTS